jgi:hypothetical protein
MSGTGDGSDFLLGNSRTSIEGVDCITAADPVSADWAIARIEEEPLEVTDDSSDLPARPEQGPGLWVDRLTLSSRSEQDSNAILISGLRFPRSGFNSFFLIDVSVTHCFSWIDPHIHERAPPRPA